MLSQSGRQHLRRPRRSRKTQAGLTDISSRDESGWLCPCQDLDRVNVAWRGPEALGNFRHAGIGRQLRGHGPGRAVPAPARSPLRGHARCAIIPDRPCHGPVAGRCAGPELGARALAGGAGRGPRPAGAARGASPAGRDREPGAVRGAGLRPVIHGHRGMGRRRGSGHLGCVRRDRRSAVRVHIPADPAEAGRGRPR